MLIMTIYNSENIDSFIEAVQNNHNFIVGDSPFQEHTAFKFSYKTVVDQNLDPFSESYFLQQIKLYEEISGRKLNQNTGELHTVNVESLIMSANPLGIHDPNFVSNQIRTITAMLCLCNLEADSRVLDMGAGHGLASELFAYCGCNVDAVDIDPVLSNMSEIRSANKGFRINRVNANFDSLDLLPDNAYSAAFFFQSLHHSLKPWELIAKLKSKLMDGGKIAFSGEPIQSNWWKHWGIRLDAESVFVARAYGWFESGWSRSFIRNCFARNGFDIIFFEGGLNGGEIGIASLSSLDTIIARASIVGHKISAESIPSFLSQVGTPSQVCGQCGIDSTPCNPRGYLLYGPYHELGPGCYTVEFFIEKRDSSLLPALFDITSSSGSHVLHSELLFSSKFVCTTIFIESVSTLVETRILITENSGWSCTLPRIRRKY